MKIKIQQLISFLGISCFLFFLQLTFLPSQFQGQEVLEQDEQDEFEQDDQDFDDQQDQDDLAIEDNEEEGSSDDEMMMDDGFKPTISPYGRIHLFLEGALNAEAESAKESALQFRAKTMKIGLEGEIIPMVSYDVAFSAGGPDANVGVDAASITLGVVPDVLNIGLGYDAGFSLVSREAKSGGKYLFTGSASVTGVTETDDGTGLAISGSMMGDKFHYRLFLTNADSYNITKFDASMKAHKFGLRLEYDFMQPWSHGNEWLRNRTNFTVGVGLSYSPWEERLTVTEETVNAAASIASAVAAVAALTGVQVASPLSDDDLGRRYYSRKGVMRLGADIGFSTSMLYLQAALGMLSGKDFTAFNTERDIESGLAFNVDLAISLMKNRLVPAVRLDYMSGSDDGEFLLKGVKKSKMAVWFVINWLPMASHAFKIQPEFYMELENKLSEVSQPKRARARISTIVNF